jgi:hypothetical protein
MLLLTNTSKHFTREITDCPHNHNVITVPDVRQTAYISSKKFCSRLHDSICGLFTDAVCSSEIMTLTGETANE